MQPNEIAYLITGTAIVGLAALRSFSRKKSGAQRSQDFTMALIWFVIIMLMVAAGVYWKDFKDTKFYAALTPGTAHENASGGMEFMRATDGHFHIEARVNGTPIRFMVDTGAARIVLTKSDARTLGFNPDELTFDTISSTANGMTRGATVTLRDMAIGHYHTGPILGDVNEGELENSLLGMQFLDKMKSYKIEGDKLTIYH